MVAIKKVKEILEHGEVKGKPLTTKQKGFFGARASRAAPKLPKPYKHKVRSVAGY